MTTAVRFENASKQFGDTVALRDLSLTIPAGGIFGLVGNNGAGKTTVIRVVLGLTSVDTGNMTLFDNAEGVRIGYSPELAAPYGWMTAREYLELGAALASVPGTTRDQRIASLLERVHLQDSGMRVSEFTVGMRQQLAIAYAMVGAPDLLILDEPTSALDPTDEYDLVEIIASFRDETTILFVSHVLRDVELIADSVAIMDGGSVIASGTMDELRLQLDLQSRTELIHPSLEDVFAALTEGAP